MSKEAAWSDRSTLLERFILTRRRSEALAEPLSPEDMGAQSMPDASPTKWHLAHTSWFFSCFLPEMGQPPDWARLFNSYYQSIGPVFSRPARSLLTRPALAEVMDWRAEITARVEELSATADETRWRQIAPLLRLGIAHEEQHQELILTDILHLLASNPLNPAYAPFCPTAPRPATPLGWIAFPGGINSIGADPSRFAFDNERPNHRVYLEPWRLASRLVTNGEYLEFIQNDGYQRPEFWLSDGWTAVQAECWGAPLYWRWLGGRPYSHTLAGLLPIDREAPVAHVSYYEAEAYARWRGKRLPSEAEWECSALDAEGNDLSTGLLRPLPAPAANGAPVQMFGDVWEWTASPYGPYPGFKPLAGAAGEYNGKFMINQMVLRGGSCVSPPGHLRASYRNFFPPATRWQFSGVRLAEDA